MCLAPSLKSPTVPALGSSICSYYLQLFFQEESGNVSVFVLNKGNWIKKSITEKTAF